MPQARWLGEHSPKTPMQRYDIVCVHTIVGFAPAHAAHFSVHHDGTIDQSRDTRYRSAANLNGNHRVIAIENEDHGAGFPSWGTNDGHAVPALTAAQVEANAKILAWAHTTHGIPLQLCPNSKPTSRGLAYHRQGIDGNWAGYKYGGRVSGGEVWSTSRGKVCPGDRRIDQLPAILARAKQIVNGDDDMTPAELRTELESFFAAKTLTYADSPVSRDRAIELAAQWSGSNSNTLRYRVLKEIAAVRANVGGDAAAIAAELAPLVIPPIVAAVGQASGLTVEQVEDAAERALRDVLGTLDES
jgi:hypothetical protein